MKSESSERAAGVLLPVFSLPSPYGIGCLSVQAFDFVDFLAEAGQKYWQILPLGPTGYGDSPYQSFSTFAGNPYLIDLEYLIQKGWLSRRACEQACRTCESEGVDYAYLSRTRLPLLRRAYDTFCRTASPREQSDFAAFCQKQRDWLPDYAHFMAIKQQEDGRPLIAWPLALRQRDQAAMERSRSELAGEISFYCFLQYLFFVQWEALHSYARHRGVSIIGDLPIYVSADSADVWTEPSLFDLDAQLHPRTLAGCPPDGFSEKGQLWGNPLYRWDVHAKEEYAWWVARLRHAFCMYDVLRIDHFRGFASYYAIPAGAEDARTGEWKRGPGVALFRAVGKKLGAQHIIAEDLGYMTDEVRALLADCGYPGMKVLQFAFDTRDGGSKNDHLPHNYAHHCVAYTGTHDNQTLSGWLQSISAEEMRTLREYLCDFDTPTARLPQRLISLLLQSPAELCIVPLQDYLELDDRARINTPGTQSGNWHWRVRAQTLNEQLAKDIRAMTQRYGR